MVTKMNEKAFSNGHFTVRTESGSTTIPFASVVAVTMNLVEDTSDVYIYDIHLSSGTIFTTQEEECRIEGKIWFSAWMSLQD
jgi:hypothetical protein